MSARRQQQNQQDQQQWRCHNGRYVQWFDLHGVCRYTDLRYCGSVFHTVAAHQQPVGIDDPGNDDAIRAVKLIAGAMADAVLEGKQGNQEAAPAEDAANA